MPNGTNLSRWQLVLELPAEEPTVELGGRFGIWLLGVDQTRRAGQVVGPVDECVVGHARTMT